MKHRLGQLLALIVCLQLCGGHWAILQTIAWGKMLVTYTQQSGLKTGLKETFDGQHPCCRCKAITKARAEEQTQKNDKIPLKLSASPEVLLSESVTISTPPVQKAYWIPFYRRLKLRSYSPPTPPPRSLNA